jgi:two-component system catabolic regulation response regulator CreB
VRGNGQPVLIVDDDRGFRVFVPHLLERAGLPAVEAARGEDAIDIALLRRPSAVLLDLVLPDIGGFEVCRELRDLLGDDLPIIFVSGERVEAHDRTVGLLLGGDDYLVKPVDPDELLTRLRRAVSRSRGNGAQPLETRRNGLTERELEVLRLLARGVDGSGIARQLVISPKTVASHLQRVMAKLGVHSRAQAVARAYEDGLIASTPDVETHDAAGAL